MNDQKPKQNPPRIDQHPTPVDLHTVYDPPTGHTEDEAAQRDAITHEYPTTPGSSTGETQVMNYIGRPGMDYDTQLHPESSWQVVVSVRKLV